MCVWPLNNRKAREIESERGRTIGLALSPLFSAALYSALISIESQRAALTLSEASLTTRHSSRVCVCVCVPAFTRSFLPR